MSRILTVASLSLGSHRAGLIRGYFIWCQAAFLWSFCPAAAWATPVILNVPLTMMPGSVIGVEGSGFGSSPQLYFGTNLHPVPFPVKIIKADNNFIAFEVPKNLGFEAFKVAVSDGSTWSQIVYSNLPRAMQFDTPEIASNDSFRIFGRNLYVPKTVYGALPTVTLVDNASGVRLAATINLSKSDPYRLTVTAPSGIVAGHSYRALVSNGSVRTWSDTSILGRPATGTDHFNLGVPWGRDYIYQNGPKYNGTVDNNDHHVYNVTNDPFLALHAKGDGVNDDQPAIQAAINQASWHGGGLVYLPPGKYRMASPSGSGIWMASNVVLQGHSADDTTILIGPPTEQPSSYIFWGFFWNAGSTASGLADVSIKNIDTRSQAVNALVSGGPISKLFVARVNFDLGTGPFLSLHNADRLVFENSTIHQAINRQRPQPPSADNSGVGPIWFDHLTNFTFRNNTVWWASSGNAFLTVNAGVMEGNHFTRSASDKIVVTASNISWLNGDATDQPITVGQSVQRQMGRQIAVDFANDLVIQNNVFDVSDGVLLHNLNDGETINSEGGGGGGAQQDVGTVTSATATSVTANSKTWTYVAPSAYNSGSMIAIVSGQGEGQWRQIVSLKNNTFTVSAPWDIKPASGDNFAIFVPSMQNTLIRNNVMQGNPRGILLYAAGHYNVSIINNTLTDNGGIWLFSIQDTQGLSFNSPKIGSLRNIEVNGNTVTNTQGLYPAYINVVAALEDPNFVWGTGLDGIEVRNNSVTAKAGTPRYDFPDGGYMNSLSYVDGAAPYSPNGWAYGIKGTIFQGNSCANCPINFSLSTGVSDTIIWNSVSNGAAEAINGAAPAAALTPVIYNLRYTNTPGAVGTVTGND